MGYEVLIEKGKIREFARAAHSRDPAYQAERPVIPPTFLTIAQFSWATPPTSAGQVADPGFDQAPVLHGEEEFEFFDGLPRAGEVLSAEARLGDQWEKEGRRGGTMRFAKIIREFRNEAGELVAEQRTTLIETARPPKEA